MFRSHLRARPFYIGAAGAALLLCAKPGASEPSGKGGGKERRACEIAYKNALQLEQSAHLRQARDLLLSCAKSACGSSLRQRCTVRYAQLESDIPSVVPLVTTEAGEPRVDVPVTMDGEQLTPRLDGRALPVDPGLHEFSFTADGAVINTQKVMIVQGQRNRPIAVSMRPDKRGPRAALGPPVPAGAADAKASLDKPAADRQALETPERESSASPKVATEKTADKAAAESSASEASPPEPPPPPGPGAPAKELAALALLGVCWRPTGKT